MARIKKVMRGNRRKLEKTPVEKVTTKKATKKETEKTTDKK